MDDTQSIDSESKATNDRRLEENIIRIILKIKKSRSRPCYQNILTLVNRGGNTLSLENVKELLNNMVEQNLICDKGKEGTESFYVLEGETYTSDDENAETMDSENPVINEKFYDTIMNKIKVEVKSAIEFEFKNKNISLRSNPEFNNITENNTNKNSDTNDALIKTLHSEIAFLRSEVSSKDTIIKLLIKERDDSNCNANKNKIWETVAHNNIQRFNNKRNDNLIKDNKYANKDLSKANVSGINDEENNINKQDDILQYSNKEKEPPIIKKKRSTVIIGDSILKDIEPYKMRLAVGKSEKIFMKSFAGADTESMEHYVVPSKKYEIDLVILHFGTNDLRGDKNAEDIAQGIINVGVEMKTKTNEVMISSILPRRDNIDLDNKGVEVNKLLNTLCSVYNFNFVTNCNILKEDHLNKGGLHLNSSGTYALVNNLLRSTRL